MISTPKPSAPAPAAFDHSAEPLQGVFEPLSGPVWTAIARNKLVVLAGAVLFAVIGLAFGHTRKATYTASATVQVGQVNPNSPGFFGYVQSSAELASAFSRSIAAEPVLTKVGRKLDLPPTAVVKRLSAEPLPEAPAFRVIATGPSELAAMQLANTAANAVINYEGQSNSANPEAASLLKEYANASVRLQQAAKTLAHLSRDPHASQSVLVHAEAERDAASVRLKAVGVAYTGAVTSQAPRSGLVSLLAGASSASSNKKSKTELYGFIGLLLGVVVGCFAAVARDRLRRRRRLGGLKAEMHGAAGT
jgi:uncharacterized protein involved in exopolysaccharide biosynthesis